MPQDASKPHSQPLEQVIATVFACRSVVKYNLALSEEQKGTLLDDIDAALDVLRSQMVASSSLPAEADENPMPSHAPDKISLVQFTPDTSKEASIDDGGRQTLQALYRMYHTYLHSQQGSGVNTFVGRFNDVMTIINEVQQFITSHDGPYEDFACQIPGGGGDPLEHLRVFIADIYYIFMEFMRALSETLQQNNVCLDTEKLSSMQSEERYTAKLMRPYAERSIDLLSLHEIYENHRRLAFMKSYMTDRITESTVFLEFIKERIGVPAHKREEVSTQINKINTLLADLAGLLAEYEKTTSFLLYHRE
jgi:hypothetical protein